MPPFPPRNAAVVPISFEFFPPKTDEQREQLDKALPKLKPRGPEYVSVTFGAGGSTLSYTPETIRHLRETHADLDSRPALELYHEALHALSEGYALYSLGQISLAQRALIDDLFYAIAHAVRSRLTG